ncbi:MAG: helix-turn-helix transcriptional regulator [Candidatus Gastranaerophilales bacterium]|nr:helix-turn-helix transcriptional regulator [Candidatus Gastranaerophilales bacterium]
MQDENKKHYFIEKVGMLLKNIRIKKNISISKISSEYDIDKSTWSKIERGFYSIELATIWRMAEALDMKFSEFSKLLEKELGDNFKLIDE